MPRPKKQGSAGAAEPKKRSRTGCWPCKARKVKCGEEKPACANCVKSGESCDYSIRLNWGGRTKKDHGSPTGGEIGGSFTFVATPSSVSASAAKTGGGGHEHVFSSQHIATAPSREASRPRSSAGPGSLRATPEEAAVGEGGGYQARLPAVRAHQRSASDLGQYQQPGAQQLPPYSHFASGLQSPRTAGPRSPPTSAPNDFTWSPQHAAKRIKLSPRTTSPVASQFGHGLPMPSPSFAVAQYPPQSDQQTPASTYFTPHSISSIVNTPATPSSSINSTSPHPGAGPSLTVQDPPDLRRLSVKSLLSDPSDEAERPRYPRTDSYGYRTHGYDHGLPDLDIPRNDDHAAIGPRSPDLRRPSAAVSEKSTSSNEPDARHIAFEPGGYYSQPVAIKIPRNLEPLPQELTSNPMNLLYFHHFLNHTARIMVPHDCFENPLRGVLPQMAVRNNHLLHLMLAFSASHRARLLNHPEPANRIAEWMSDVLPALRQALDGKPSSPTSTSTTDTSDPTDPTSLAPLATAIMLASLEIISPNTFAVPIPWQSHLSIARQLIIAKGGLHHIATSKADGARDKAIFFLSRWFAYLDVLGSLSGSEKVQPLWGAYLEDGGGLWLVNRSDEEIYQIDCFFGFSGRCIALLAAVAELAVSCEAERMDPSTRQPRPEWRPDDATRRRAEELRLRLEASAKCVYRGCMHTSVLPEARPDTPSAKDTEQDVAEIYSTNSMFHYAALLHLSRRVLNLPHTDPRVQSDVARMIDALSEIRKGSTAESCLLFPIFTAGCEATATVGSLAAVGSTNVGSGGINGDRAVFMERMLGVEGWGMAHVGAARRLMERVWEARDALERSGGNGQGREMAGWVDWVGWAGGEFFG